MNCTKKGKSAMSIGSRLKAQCFGFICAVTVLTSGWAEASELMATEMLHFYAKTSAQKVLEPAGLSMVPGTLDVTERQTYAADLRPALRAITGNLVEDYVAEFSVVNSAGQKRQARMLLRVAIGHAPDAAASQNQTLINTVDRSGTRAVRALILGLGQAETNPVSLRALALQP